VKSNNFNVILSGGFTYYENDVNVKDVHGNTPLYYAARNGNKEICEFLLNHHAKVNIRCKGGNTPLHMAFASGQVMVKKKYSLIIILLDCNLANLKRRKSEYP